MTLQEQIKMGYDVYKETLTLPNAAATNSDTKKFSVPPGRAFTVIANEGATNTASNGDVDILGSYDGTTFFTALADLIDGFDTVTKVAKYDPANQATHPAFPFYKVRLTHDGNQSAESVIVTVLVEKE